MEKSLRLFVEPLTTDNWTTVVTLSTLEERTMGENSKGFKGKDSILRKQERCV